MKGPCLHFDIRSGKPVLIGDANDTLQWAMENVPELVDEVMGEKKKPKAEKKLSDAFAKWKAATGKQGIAFDPKSQSEAVSEMDHWTGWRDIANDYGVEIEMPSTKAVDFKSDETVAVLKLSYDLELGLMRRYEAAWNDAESVSLKVDIQKYVKIQRKAVGEYADLLAEIESVGVGFVNQRLQA